MKKIKDLLIILFLSLPLFVFGEFATPTVTVTTAGQVLNIINFLTKVAYTLFIALTVLFLILAAFNYLTAQGDEGKVKTAKKQVVYAVVAIVIAILAFSVSSLVTSLIEEGRR